VFRHNKVTNANIIQHDLGSTPRARGNRAVEVYENTFTCTIGASNCFTAMNATRGGTGLFYNNTITGYNLALWAMIWRVAYNTSFIGGGYPSQTGTMKVCEDITRHCTAGNRRPCNNDADCSGAGTCNKSFTCSTNADCSAYNGGPGLCVQLDGSLGNGYPLRDQMGRGKDDITTGVQADSPVYWWSNTKDGSSVSLSVSDMYSYYIQKGRDFRNHGPAVMCGAKTGWTYAQYTYPHPLQGTDSNDTTPPAVPTGLTVR